MPARGWGRHAIALVLVAAAGCPRPAASPARVEAHAGEGAAPPWSSDALFVAAELEFDGRRVVTTFESDENGRTTSSESEIRWRLRCVQAPRPPLPGRRIAELTCESRELPDDEAEPTSDGAGADAAGDDDDRGEPFPIDLSGYWVATADGLWHTADPADELIAVERLMSLPPVAREDAVADPEADPDRDPPAQSVYATRASDGGAWCHERVDDPGGGAEASVWGLCLDARGLLSGSASDGHGAVVWEATFTRR